jgi:hypothetical protein
MEETETGGRRKSEASASMVGGDSMFMIFRVFMQIRERDNFLELLSKVQV